MSTEVMPEFVDRGFPKGTVNLIMGNPNGGKSIMIRAGMFAHGHVNEGSRELREWSFTGLLKKDGVVNKCADIVRPLVGDHNALRVAQECFQDAALAFCADYEPCH